MKRIYLPYLFSIFLLSISNCFCQTIVKNEVDEFTNYKVINTSWETIQMNSNFTAYFRVRKVNETVTLDWKIILGSRKPFIINKGDELMLKLNSGEIVKLQNIEYSISCIGCGSKGINGSGVPGIEVNYFITQSDIDKILASTVSKIRIYTSEGYIEDELKENSSKKIISGLNLVSN